MPDIDNHGPDLEERAAATAPTINPRVKKFIELIKTKCPYPGCGYEGVKAFRSYDDKGILAGSSGSELYCPKCGVTIKRVGYSYR